MRNLSKELDNRKIDYDKLLEYGFSYDGTNYNYQMNILNDSFKVIVTIEPDKMYSKLIELELNDEFFQVDVVDATGSYIGLVKDEYEKVINDILEKCFTIDVFKSVQTKQVIKYIKDKYNDELEFLWKSYPDTAIWRNKINNKWYGLLVTISESKLNIKSDKIVEAIDLMYQKDSIDKIIDNNKVYPGYHMNKKSWITIKLDNSLETSEIFKLIDNSYNISISKK